MVEIHLPVETKVEYILFVIPENGDYWDRVWTKGGWIHVDTETDRPVGVKVQQVERFLPYH
jgi:hypothetical protein